MPDFFLPSSSLFVRRRDSQKNKHTRVAWTSVLVNHFMMYCQVSIVPQMNEIARRSDAFSSFPLLYKKLVGLGKVQGPNKFFFL